MISNSISNNTNNISKLLFMDILSLKIIREIIKIKMGNVMAMSERFI